MENNIRELVYIQLGLEFGSLVNEGGRDWNEALSIVKEDLKKNEINENIDYCLISKDDFRFIYAIESKEYKDYCNKIQISSRQDISEIEMQKLLLSNDKDVMINIAKNKNISNSSIEYIKQNGTYLSKKILSDRLL